MAAQAHVTATPNQGKPGGYIRTSFAITHGCEGSATTIIRIRLPPDVVIALPQAKPGWTIVIGKEKLAPPLPAGHGRMLEERVSEVEWRGRLDDAHYDEFGLSVKLPEGGGRVLYFPVTQICEQGSQEWSQIPQSDQRWGDLKFPALFITLLPDAPAPPAPMAVEHKH